MSKTILILIAVILVVAPIVLIFRTLYDIADAAIQRTKNRIKALIPTWIRGK